MSFLKRQPFYSKRTGLAGKENETYTAHRDPFYEHVIECIIKSGMKLLIHSYTSMVQPVKFENG